MTRWLSPAVLGALALFGTEPSVRRPDGRMIATSQIAATIRRLMEAAHVTGVGLAMFHKGRVAYVKAYGARDTERRLPLTPNSVMTAASLTKSAFASVVMRLTQEGAI